MLELKITVCWTFTDVSEEPVASPSLTSSNLKMEVAISSLIYFT
jgi:hypothetical protein